MKNRAGWYAVRICSMVSGMACGIILWIKKDSDTGF